MLSIELINFCLKANIVVKYKQFPDPNVGSLKYIYTDNIFITWAIAYLIFIYVTGTCLNIIFIKTL